MLAKRATYLALLSVCLVAVASGLPAPSSSAQETAEAVQAPSGRILGGEDAASGEYPWLVSLRLNKVHTCSGCIISQRHVLTAASCVSELGTTAVNVNDVTLRVGSINQYAGGSLVAVSQIVIHPSYGNFMHNMAVITLKEPLTFNEKINKIELPAKPEESEGEEEIPNLTPVYVAGWGELLGGEVSYKLQKANFNTLSSPYCELEAGYGYDSTLCLTSAEKHGVCRGDAGAGVIGDNKTLLGLVSFFFGNCGTKYPDVASRVSYYHDWILANTQ